MLRMPFRLALAALAFCLLALGGDVQAQKKKSEKLEALMKKKLAQSQKILEGVALQDFDMIGKHAKELIEIGKQAEWKILKTPLYQMYMNEFSLNAEELASAAKKKNLDGAALAYVNLTLTCVKCHKHVREKRVVRAE